MTGVKGKIILLFAGLCFSLLIAEILLRSFVSQETKRLAMYDKDLGWRGVPHGEGRYIRSIDGIDEQFRYNGEGFRDEDFPSIDTPGFQVILLGDSFVESLEVPYEDLFHEKVEEELKRLVSPLCAVVNISSQGYSTAQELLAYRKFRPRLNPSVVLLAFYEGNDFEDNMRMALASLGRNGEVQFPANEDSWLDTQVQVFQRWMYEYSHVVFFAKNAIENLFHQRISQADKEEKRVSAEEKYRMTCSLLREMHGEMRRTNVPFGIVLIPSRKGIEMNRTERLEVVASACSDFGIPLLRLDGALTPDQYFEVDGHFTAEGHEIVSRHIMEFLQLSFGVGPGGTVH